MGLSVEQKKIKINEFVTRIEYVQKKEYHPAENGILFSYVGGPLSDQLMNEIRIFSERHLKSHPLYSDIADACSKHKKRLSAHKDIAAYLKSILTDDEFWQEDDVGLQNESTDSDLLTVAKQVLRQLVTISNKSTEEMYIEDNDRRLSNYPNYRQIFSLLNQEGYFAKFIEDVIGGYEIVLSSKAFTASEQRNMQPVTPGQTSHTTNIYISGDVKGSNISSGDNSINTSSNSHENGSKTWFEKYGIPIIVALIGAAAAIIAAVINLNT